MQGAQGLAVGTVGAWRQSPANKLGHYSNIWGILDCEVHVRQGPTCVSILTATTKQLAKRRNLHTKGAQAQNSGRFTGYGNIQGIHECIFCPSESDSEGAYSVFSLVNFSPDQSLPRQMGLKSTTLLYPPRLENWLKGRAQTHILLPLPFPSLPGSPRERKSKRE